MKFDLHIHTNHSDGIYSPEEIVELAVDAGLKGIAITDHDTISAIEGAMKYSNTNHPDFKIIPGIEFGSMYQEEEVHILGYFINYNSLVIINTSNELRKSRLIRGRKIIEKINGLGLDISIEDLESYCDKDYIGRPHIARAMVDKGYVSSVSQAFDKYLNKGMPAYIDRYRLSIEDTVRLIKASGGLSILAHPGLLKNPSIIDYCIDHGIDGIECIHSKHNLKQEKHFKKLAHLNNLMITGGSDFHGDAENHKNNILGRYYVDLSSLPDFKERI